MNRAEWVNRAESLAEQAALGFGYEVVDVEMVKEGTNDYLRIYIDKEGGISIDDCEKMSREISDSLDQEDFIDIPYILEVSSPGLTRALTKEKHYIRYIGSRVEVHLYKIMEIDGNKLPKTFLAYIDSYDNRVVGFRLDNNKIIKLNVDNLASCRLSMD